MLITPTQTHGRIPQYHHGQPLQSPQSLWKKIPFKKTGILTVRVFKGRGLSLPPDVPLPPDVERAVLSQAAYDRHASKWWLPYVVLEHDKNAILINSGEGELSSPTWGGQKGIL